VFSFSSQLLSEKFSTPKRIEGDTIKNAIGVHLRTRNACQIVMKLEFSRQIFEKYSNIEFHEYPSSGSRVVSHGRTDGRTEAHT
jgi:hypothetical protein